MEIIESLVWLNKKITKLLSQYTTIDEYEDQLISILRGNDEII